ncbi:uncharacterized protein LOC111380488 [Olea europaea subsp. europaea]|uniref:Uncharacterized protein LOC111380488 n=1 Tax=Olea europaea subsp. europaea TaxID=158383 RepID=A0A8S0RY03_OLEEU|nr:uncharacterized protein LOC111380488 [Olea europaea subsp. europaea]
MAAISGLIINSSGVNNPTVCISHPKLLYRNHNPSKRGFNKCRDGFGLLTTRIRGVRNQYHLQQHSGTQCFVSARGNYQSSSFNRDSDIGPFWLNMMKEAIWTIRNLLLFLVEQPSQLQYIEWPNFQSTLKTAILTLVLVALLIVALSSVDSALSYLLALLLRRKA